MDFDTSRFLINIPNALIILTIFVYFDSPLIRYQQYSFSILLIINNGHLEINAVNIDVFNELNYGFDQNQLHSPFSQSQATPKKQKTSGFGEFYFFWILSPAF